jgi:hypothetical protein
VDLIYRMPSDTKLNPPVDKHGELTIISRPYSMIQMTYLGPMTPKLVLKFYLLFVSTAMAVFEHWLLFSKLSTHAPESLSFQIIIVLVLIQSVR